jgi:hypothetical protein
LDAKPSLWSIARHYDLESIALVGLPSKPTKAPFGLGGLLVAI